MTQGSSSSQLADPPYPKPSYAWYVVTLLSAGVVLSFVDRYILSLLIEPIKASLGLTDLQIGLLIGPAFTIFYVSVGLPLGWLADRKSRRVILAIGIAGWSLMTAACGLARSFGSLFAARIGVGMGEASLGPCAVSLISDYFPKERRPKAIGFYMTGAFVGAGSTYVIGGQIIQLISGSPPVVLPVFGELLAWQTAFIAVGLPGLLLAALMLTVREPLRREKIKFGAANGNDESISMAHAARFLLSHWKAYGSVFIGSAGVTALGALSFWSPAMFQRTWGWDVGKSGLAIGAALLLAGLPGTNLGGWLAAWLTAKGRPDAPYWTVLIGSVILFPAFVLFPLMPSGELAVLLMFIGFFGMAIQTGTSPTAVITITPSQLRGRATAVFFLVINLFGALLGPPMVGWITDLYGDPNALRYAMAITSLLFGIVMVVVLVWGRKHYLASAEAMERSTAETAG